MANIKTYEAPEFRLTPLDGGAKAMAQLGQVQHQYGKEAGQALREAGSALKSGINAIGNAVTGFEERAQQHTDALAEVDFQKQQAAAEIAAIGGVNEASTPIDQNGQPIYETVGRGGGLSLPSNATVPSPGSFAVVASQRIESHEQLGEGAVERARSMGASQKMQDKIAARVAESNGRLGKHAATLRGEVAATHLIHSTEQTVNTITAGIDRDPSQLDNGLIQIHDTIAAAAGSMTGNFEKAGAKHFLAAEQKARTDAITASAESLARSGQPGKAYALLDNKKYDKDFTGQQRESLKTRINSLSNESSANEARVRAKEQYEQAVKIDTVTGDMYERSRLDPSDPKYVKNPMAEIDRQFFGNDKIAARREFALLQKNEMEPVSPGVSDKVELDIQQRIDDGTLTKAAAQNEIKQHWGDRELNRAAAQRLDRYATAAETSEGKYTTTQRKQYFNMYETMFGGGRGMGGAFSTTHGGEIFGKSQLDAVQLENTIGADGKRMGATIYDPKSPNYIGRDVNGKPSQFMLDHQLSFLQKIYQQMDAMGIKRKDTAAPASAAVTGAQPGSADPVIAKIPTGSATPQVPMSGQPVVPPAPAKVQTEQDVQKLAPGSRFIIPSGPHQGKIGTTPKKINYAPESGGIENAPGIQAINAAITPVEKAHPAVGEIVAKQEGADPIQIASAFVGKHEVANRAELAQFFINAGGARLDPKTTAWCARFVNSVLGSTGVKGSGSDLARSFLKIGSTVQPTEAKAGDVIVFPRGQNPIYGHVGFIKSIDPGNNRVTIISGNDSNAVRVSTRPLDKALGIRRIGQQHVGMSIQGVTDQTAIA